MNDLSTIYNYFNFILVAFLVVIILAILLLFYCRKDKTGNIPRGKMKLYGIMMNMNKKHILAISLVIINYLFLICGLLFYAEINALFIAITFVLTILPAVLAYKISYFIFSIISLIINCLIIFISNKIQEKTGLSSDTNILIISYLISFIGFAYYTLTVIISVNSIVNCHNILRRKKHEKEVK